MYMLEKVVLWLCDIHLEKLEMIFNRLNRHSFVANKNEDGPHYRHDCRMLFGASCLLLVA